MKRPELYQKTVDILVQAYLNDTLEHANCYACAVGNLIGSNRGYVYTDACGRKEWDCPEVVMWQKVFVTTRTTTRHAQYFNLEAMEGLAKEQILSTGYTVQQLAKIELAFETAALGNSDDEYMFNGLMAVIDVLDQIHENTDPEVTTTQKKRFTTLPTNS